MPPDDPAADAAREAWEGLDQVHRDLQAAVQQHAAVRGDACPCGPDGLRDALEHVQEAEKALEAVGWPVED